MDYINNIPTNTASPPGSISAFQVSQKDLSQVIAEQSYAGGWICPDCKFHKGGLGCNKNMFISFVGCWTKGCVLFEDKNCNQIINLHL